MRRIKESSLTALLVGVLIAGTPNWAFAVDETPPAQDSRIHLRKTLYVHKTGGGNKIFAETVKVERGDYLWKILNEDYGIDNDNIPEFIEAFKEVNPGVDPNKIYVDQEIRIPFKMVLDAVPEEVPSQADLAIRKDTYQVRSGDSLWKILKNEYGVTRHGMSRAFSEVKKANPGMKDISRLWVGQILVIPFERHNEVAQTQKPEATAGKTEKKYFKPGLPEGVVSILGLLEKLGCKVEREGERFIPLSRGRSIRLDAKDFPLITGPRGGKVLLDPKGRLTAPVIETVKGLWNYEVVRGVAEDLLEYLEKIVPALEFHEVSEGTYTIELGKGLQLEAATRWTIIPTPDALWDGGIHLIFPGMTKLDPALVEVAGKKGFALHTLGALYAGEREVETFESPVLEKSASIVGAAQLLDLANVKYQLDPTIKVKLQSGVPYTVRPLLTFEHGALKYAVPPERPTKAESLLLRAGYFTFSWSSDHSGLDKIADFMVLLGYEHEREELSLPDAGELRLKLDGLVISDADLTSKLAPGPSKENNLEKILCVEADLPGEVGAFLVEMGYLPWVMR